MSSPRWWENLQKLWITWYNYSWHQQSNQPVLSLQLQEDELKDALLLVFANKQDLPNAMSVSEITDKLGLQGMRNREVRMNSKWAKRFVNVSLEMAYCGIVGKMIWNAKGVTVCLPTVVCPGHLRYTRHGSLWGSGLALQQAFTTLKQPMGHRKSHCQHVGHVQLQKKESRDLSQDRFCYFFFFFLFFVFFPLIFKL